MWESGGGSGLSDGWDGLWLNDWIKVLEVIKGFQG